MNDKFKMVANTSSAIVNAIIDNAMFHSKKDESRRFLTLMDNYICYYINREGNELCFPTIRISSCPKWAREVFLKFLIIRLSVCYNADSTNNLTPKKQLNLSYVDPFDTDIARQARRANKYAGKLNSYQRIIKEALVNFDFLGESGHKNLIFCTEQDMMVSRTDKNSFINEFYGTEDDIFTKKNLWVCHKLTSKNIRKRITDSKIDLSIDNIFVFYTNNEECNSLRRQSIEKLNRNCNTGIRNCFVFDFSEHPYCLYMALQRDRKLSFIYSGLSEREFYSNEHFTVLTDDESRYLFQQDRKNIGLSCHSHVKDNDNLHEIFYNNLIGMFIDNTEHWIEERNKFALCLTDQITNIYKDKLKRTFSEVDVNVFDESFFCQDDFAKRIIRGINVYLQNNKVNNFAFVVGFNIPNNVRTVLKYLLTPYEAKIYNYSALKPIKVGKYNYLRNGIEEKYVFVLHYRPHNAKSLFAKYPNSFDPFVTNPGQHIIEIIQDFIFIDKYLWDKYDYDLEQYKCFNSLYRKNVLGDIYRPEKPDMKRITGDNDEDIIESHQTVKAMDVVFDNGRSYSIPENEWVIYEINGRSGYDMARLKTIKEDDLLTQVTGIQRLDEITDELSKTIIRKEEEYSRSEQIIRQTYYEKERITEEERDSDVYLWKILLAKKVAKSSKKNVYEELMTGLNETDKVQFNAFVKWTDASNSMILPLQKTTQRRLFEYLDIPSNSPYLYIMRAKKMSEINKTRSNNSMLEHFLVETLLYDVDDDSFEQFKESKLNDILHYDRKEDLQALVELLYEKINLRKVVNIVSL